VEALQAIIDQQQTVINALEVKIALLVSENEDLKARLAQNSTNSSKPPASDGLHKKTIKPALPKETGRKPGGQKGHPGHTLQMVDTPDVIQQHRPTQCTHCGITLADLPAISGAKRQVFDLPKPRLEVTEHHQMSVQCPCGCVNHGAFPALVTAPVQYGPRIQAQSILLNVDYKIGFAKVRQFWTDLVGYGYNPATLQTAQTTLCEQLEPLEGHIRTQIQQAAVAHFDETGLRVAGKLHWLHVACTTLWTYLFIHPKRGQEALQSAQSVFMGCTNWLVHDCWSSYFAAGVGHHALCGAHLLRELQGQLERGRVWAQAMQTYLLALYEATREGPIPSPEQGAWRSQYQRLCEQGLAEEPPPIYYVNKSGTAFNKRPRQTAGRNLLDRLVAHESAVLAFGFEAGVPFSNNEAERALRGAKLKQKVAGGFRTEAGVASYGRIAGFISTLRKQGYNVVEQLANVLTGQFQWTA
jgi:transposase